VGKGGRVDPQVDLEGGGGPLQGDVVAGQLERVGAGDAEAEGDLAEPAQATVPVPDTAAGR